MDNLINVLVHYVWATWDRMPLIGTEIERPLCRQIHHTCDQKRCPVLALGGAEDHLHLLVAMHNTVTMADLVEQVKGSSSHFVSTELLNGDWFRWQGNYGAFSVSPSDRNRVIQYIRRQKEHHAQRVLWEYGERTHTYPDRPFVHRDRPQPSMVREEAGVVYGTGLDAGPDPFEGIPFLPDDSPNDG